MADELSNTSSTDRFLTNNEFKDSDDDDPHVRVPATSQCTKRFRSLLKLCTGERVMITVMFVAILLLIAVVCVLYSKVDQLETQLNSESNSELEDGELSHRDHLKMLSSHLNNLKDELVTAKEEFRTNMSCLREELTELSEALDSANDNLTDLSSAQKRLLATRSCRHQRNLFQ